MDLKLLRQVDLFRNLDGVQLAHLASFAQELRMPRGQVLFREGDPPDFFYVIQQGRIRISRMVGGMGEEALAILEPGTYFGEMELIDASLPRAAQATVHEDTVLAAFQVDRFRELMSGDGELAVPLLSSFVRTLSERLRMTNDKVAAFFAMAKF
ncbi:MAG: cyclic nucleotide-binding domain-containing protein [Myxococcota bacterium]